MPGALQQVLSDKAARNAARASFDTRLEQVKTDLEVRGIGGRIVDEMVDRASVVIDEAIDVVEAHPGVIAGTIFAIVLWLFRSPVLSLIGRLMEFAGMEATAFGLANEEED